MNKLTSKLTRKPTSRSPAKPAAPDYVTLAASRINCKAKELIEYRLHTDQGFIVIIGPDFTKHRFPFADLDPDYMPEYL